MLLVVCGPPGTGKTTVAEWVADRRNAALLRTDVVRTDIVDDPEYTESERERVYDALFRRVESRLGAGETVVADGTFDRSAYRDRARDLAERVGVCLAVVRVVCDPQQVERRIRNREDDASDATVENYREINARFDPVTGTHLRVDNSGPWEETRRQLRAHVPSATRS